MMPEARRLRGRNPAYYAEVRIFWEQSMHLFPNILVSIPSPPSTNIIRRIADDPPITVATTGFFLLVVTVLPSGNFSTTFSSAERDDKTDITEYDNPIAIYLWIYCMHKYQFLNQPPQLPEL